VICHTPPLYTNNKPQPAQGFSVPEDHKDQYDILPIGGWYRSGVGPTTRRGTGYYKVPSPRRVVPRPFRANGSVATLETGLIQLA